MAVSGHKNPFGINDSKSFVFSLKNNRKIVSERKNVPKVSGNIRHSSINKFISD